MIVNPMFSQELLRTLQRLHIAKIPNCQSFTFFGTGAVINIPTNYTSKVYIDGLLQPMFYSNGYLQINGLSCGIHTITITT